MSSGILTIDDIASKNTPAIVDYLVSKGIKAVMFAIGKAVEENYDAAIYALKKGMIVGNHSYSHPNFAELSLDEGIAEIEKCEAVLNKLYEEAKVERAYRPFRFPYGSKGGKNKDALQEYFRNNGFSKLTDTQIAFPFWKKQGLDKDIDTLWTFDFAEYNIRPNSGFFEENVFDRMKDEDPGQGGSLFEEGSHHIMLLHAHDETEELVPDYYKHFIGFMLEKGFVFEQPQFMH